MIWGYMRLNWIELEFHGKLYELHGVLWTFPWIFYGSSWHLRGHLFGHLCGIITGWFGIMWGYTGFNGKLYGKLFENLHGILLEYGLTREFRCHVIYIGKNDDTPGILFYGWDIQWDIEPTIRDLGVSEMGVPYCVYCFPLCSNIWRTCFEKCWLSRNLVGGIPTRLQNMSSPGGMMKVPIYRKIIQMFQTTNQKWIFTSITHRKNRSSPLNGCGVQSIRHCPSLPLLSGKVT